MATHAIYIDTAQPFGSRAYGLYISAQRPGTRTWGVWMSASGEIISIVEIPTPALTFDEQWQIDSENLKALKLRLETWVRVI